MKRAVAVCGAVAMLFVAASAFAQGKTDFSGKWTPDPPAAGAPAGGGGGGRGGGGAGPMTITQTATELKTERTGGDGTVTATVYKLDGTEFTVMQGQNEAKGKATWDGAKLKVDITSANGVRSQVYSLEGGKLSIATTAPGRGGGEATTTTRTYTKG